MEKPRSEGGIGEILLLFLQLFSEETAGELL
jgi:hypothetical protein